MTNPGQDLEVEREETVLHDAQGFPTEDKSAAVSGEVTTTYTNGKVKKDIFIINR